MLIHALQSYEGSNSDRRDNTDIHHVPLFLKYQLLVSSVLMASLPRHFPGMFFKLITSLLTYANSKYYATNWRTMYKTMPILAYFSKERFLVEELVTPSFLIS